MGKMLERMADQYRDDNMINYTIRDYRRTWGEFDEEVNRIARAFMAMGIEKGDHVAIWATNVPQWLLTLFATAKIGGVLVTVNTAYKVFELEYLLRQSDTKMLVMIDSFKDSSYVDIVNDLCPDLKDSAPGGYNNPRLPFLKSVVYVGEGKGETPAGMINWNDLYDLAEKTPVEAFRARTDSLDPQDVVNMQYTSGTTGFPKGVMLTHYNVVNNGMCIGECMKFTHDDKLCITVPFFHCFGLVLATMACLTHGTAMVPIDYFRPTWVMDALESEKCTAVHGVPTMFIAMLEHPDFKKHDFSHMRTGIMAGSPCPVKVMRQVVDEMHMTEITIAYGQTESSPVSTQTTTDDSIEARVNTVGRVLPHVEAKIVDPETGRTLGPGQPGEFCSRGYNTMRGYYKLEEATAQAIDKDGWLHTGDIAVVDENGYYKITGRIKDMIIRGGENIYPKEIEEFYYTQDGVKDVQVIGVPDKQYGEEIMACIIKKEGCTHTEEEYREMARQHLAKHKVPKYIWFMDTFPMNNAGKIQKFKMRENAVEYLGLEKDAAIETA
ncbi:AMP-binding protein [Christensenellaceae bacterium NSJ-53]|uniref:AMP-binding protein n=2 Tax=Gehongia tenuis TaxID=2763655 RepID=A0A926HNT9_9FIRM|nr:AMP-binding protein [Gehongia tenuis]MBC8530508.1 AMP-binding protein [Gehongia tenuis]